MAFLIDTDIIIYSLKNNSIVNKNFLSYEKIPKSISVITYGELIYGAQKSQQKEKNLAIVRQIGTLFPILPVTKPIIETFGDLKAMLSKKGISIDDMDLLIGATALAENLTVVTHNTKHFDKIPGLVIVDWSK